MFTCFLSGMVSCQCFLLFSVVLRSVQLSLPRFAVLGNHQCLVCVLALLPSLTLTSCRVLGNRQVFYLSTVSCNLLVEFWAIEHLQLSFGSLDLVRSSYSPGSGSGRPPHLHQVNRCLLPRNIRSELTSVGYLLSLDAVHSPLHALGVVSQHSGSEGW